jgi:capsular polysaccharide biosynthesis protein
MEFKEFIQLIRKNFYIMFLAVIVFLAGGFLVWNYQANFFAASFAIDIDRGEFQETEEYRYDQFYRLQADEKFAENIVSWIQSPGFLSQLSQDFSGFSEKKSFAGVESLRASQPSSNYVRVEYKSQNKALLKPTYQVLKKNLTQKTQDLNYENSDPTWFKLNYGKLNIYRVEPKLIIYLALSLGAGLLFGIFLILFKHYLKN